MSGGSYDYLYLRLQEGDASLREMIARLERTHPTSRALADMKLMLELGRRLAPVAHAVEWEDSGDTRDADAVIAEYDAAIARKQWLIGRGFVVSPTETGWREPHPDAAEQYVRVDQIAGVTHHRPHSSAIDVMLVSGIQIRVASLRATDAPTHLWLAAEGAPPEELGR